MMRILVTGGAGFIGSHLCEKLLDDGHVVDVLDDLSTGSVENIAHLLGREGFRFIRGTVLDEMLMTTAVHNVDMVYHLAAAVGVELIVNEPVRTLKTNIRGTEVVLDLCNKFGTKVLIASTSEIYGKSTAVPFREDDDRILGSTTFSRWSYSTSKAVDEFLALAYHRQFGLPVVVTRFFNTVGPRQTGQYGMVIPRFVDAALDGHPITVYGTGEQSRCFGYVGDIVWAMVGLMGSTEAEGQVFNVGSNQEISIFDLAVKIKRMTGSRSEIVRVTYEEAYGQSFDDMMRRLPSLEKVNRFIGYEPSVDLDGTLDRVIAYAKARRGAG